MHATVETTPCGSDIGVEIVSSPPNRVQAQSMAFEHIAKCLADFAGSTPTLRATIWGAEGTRFISSGGVLNKDPHGNGCLWHGSDEQGR